MLYRGAPLGEGQGGRLVVELGCFGGSGGSHVGAARGLAGNFAGGVMLGCG